MHFFIFAFFLFFFFFLVFFFFFSGLLEIRFFLASMASRFLATFLKKKKNILLSRLGGYLFGPRSLSSLFSFFLLSVFKRKNPFFLFIMFFYFLLFSVFYHFVSSFFHVRHFFICSYFLLFCFLSFFIECFSSVCFFFGFFSSRPSRHENRKQIVEKFLL